MGCGLRVAAGLVVFLQVRPSSPLLPNTCRCRRRALSAARLSPPSRPPLFLPPKPPPPQVAAALAVILMTALKLNKVDFKLTPGGEGGPASESAQGFVAALQRLLPQAQITDACMIGKPPPNAEGLPIVPGANMCYYAFAVGGLSLLATLALSILQCVTCNLCGMGPLLDAAFALVGAAWWAVAAVLFTQTRDAPYNSVLPLPEWREALVVVAWVGCALFGLWFLISVARVFDSCCGGRCCGGGGGGGGARRAGGGGRSAPRCAPVYMDAPKGQFISGAPAQHVVYVRG